MTTHSSNLAWGIPWSEEPGELQSMGLQRVGQNRMTHTHTHTHTHSDLEVTNHGREEKGTTKDEMVGWHH